jgi:hypothetical protein
MGRRKARRASLAERPSKRGRPTKQAEIEPLFSSDEDGGTDPSPIEKALEALGLEGWRQPFRPRMARFIVRHLAVILRAEPPRDDKRAKALDQALWVAHRALDRACKQMAEPPDYVAHLVSRGVKPTEENLANRQEVMDLDALRGSSPRDRLGEEKNARAWILVAIRHAAPISPKQSREDVAGVLGTALERALERVLRLAPPLSPDGTTPGWLYGSELCLEIVRRELHPKPTWRERPWRNRAFWATPLDATREAQALQLAGRLLREGAKRYGYKGRVLHPGGSPRKGSR